MLIRNEFFRSMSLYKYLAFALTAVGLLAETPPPAEQPSVTFRSDVSLVRVDAQVVDDQNRPIRGLGPADFALRVNGNPQEARQVITEKVPIDLLILLDVSRSMQPHVERVASAAHQALSILGDQDRIAILVFDRDTRVRMPFRNSGQEAESELDKVVSDESFEGGTDITKALVDASNYMSHNARRDARRAIVILTDDQTELDRDDARVLRALERADSVLSALIAPDALHTGAQRRVPFDDADGLFGELQRRGLIPPEFGKFTPGVFGPRTRSAGTSKIARKSGGDSMDREESAAFENTVARIRERYGVFFYLPEGAKPGDEKNVEVNLSDAARQRYPDAQLQYRHLSASSSAQDWV